MRGVAGTQASGLPVSHWRGPNGGALCGARRRWGVLIAAYHNEVECRRCRARLEQAECPAGALKSGAPGERDRGNPMGYAASEAGSNPVGDASEPAN